MSGLAGRSQWPRLSGGEQRRRDGRVEDAVGLAPTARRAAAQAPAESRPDPVITRFTVTATAMVALHQAAEEVDGAGGN